VNLALAASVPPTASEFIEFQTILPPGGVLERGVWSSTALLPTAL
jgi:hypothetical protein